MKKNLSYLPLPLLLALLITACQKNDTLIIREDGNEIADELLAETYLKLPPIAETYQRDLPLYLQAVGMKPKPVNDPKALIGRVLFYDVNLSKDHSVSCASCHKQSVAFSDNVAFSKGVHGQLSTRNSMPIANVANFSAHYAETFSNVVPLLLWDNRAATVAEQSKMAFTNSREMGMTMDEVVAEVKSLTYYKHLWKKAYDQADVTEDRLLECLTEFVGAMGGAKTRFDEALIAANGNINLSSTTNILNITQAYNGTDTTITTIQTGLPGFSASENNGRDLFVANCSKCHSPIRSFQEVIEACNGLDLQYNDQGKGELTGLASDNGVFKSPSLRNIALTAPYMHDGRFKTLEQVIEFYSTGVKEHPNLHPAMKHNGNIRLNLSATQKKDLLAFLKTLTDHTIATDERFSNPFR